MRALVRCFVAAAVVLVVTQLIQGQTTQAFKELPAFAGPTPLVSNPVGDPLVQDVGFTPPDKWPNFLILIWQYKTDATKDSELYRQAGFWGFHIDRGAGQEKLVDFARQQKMPYYVDHLAGKGHLHLSDEARKKLVEEAKPGQLLPRPNSLADEDTIKALKKIIADNIKVVRQGPVVAYSLDDEISTGSFNTPIETDSSKDSVALYRQWLEGVYTDIDKLNAVWGTSYKSFKEAVPVAFESVRPQNNAAPFAKWNLSRWMDWRSYMDSQFAGALSQLARYTNSIDPSVPVGFVGGQQPAPYGGFDYAKICRVAQFIESYDIGGTNEIIRSLWCYPQRRPFVQTFFSTGDARRDSWFLWYYLLHGNRGVIAWPDRENTSWFHAEGGLAKYVKENAATAAEVQGEFSKKILDLQTRFDSDPIAILYSHPSVQASWVMDVQPHGKTWPNRWSSMDNSSQTAGKNREAWFKLLEDCGFQYDVVPDVLLPGDYLIKQGYRVLILDRAVAMSDAQAAAIERFVSAGGTVIADELTALLTEHGVGREKGALDNLFGIARDESKGYLDSKTIAEINAEKGGDNLMPKLSAYEASLKHNSIAVYERGTKAKDGKARATVETADVLIEKQSGKGRTVYLNLTPVAYYDMNQRLGDYGQQWRQLLADLLGQAKLKARATVTTNGQPVPMTELLYWRNGGKLIVGVVKNPARQGSITGAGEVHGVTGQEQQITLTFARPMKNIVNLRTGEKLPSGATIQAQWKPWEGLVFEMEAGE